MMRTLRRWLGIVRRPGPARGRPGGLPWGGAGALAPALVPVGGGGGRIRTRALPGPALPLGIFGRHKDAGPEEPGEPGAAADVDAPAWADDEPRPAGDAPPSPEPAGASPAVELPDWATESLGSRLASTYDPAGSDAPPPDWSGEGGGATAAAAATEGSDATATAAEPDLGAEPAAPARSWRARQAGAAWTDPGPPAAPADADPGDGVAGGEPAAEEVAAAAAPEAGTDDPAVAAVAEAAPEDPPATFGVPDDPALLLRPLAPKRPAAVTAEPSPPPAVTGAGAAESLPALDLTPPPPAAEPRAFPLPEGEVVFRNLRTAFTDPARLLRHLTADGHTGVLEIISGRARSSYVVLLEGRVVAVAMESDGLVRTTSQVGFPAFPDGEDTLNVFRYPADVARGLGLLLHAPVHWSGLGAVFVDLDGLRTYLEGRRADGGLVVSHGDDLGVALFTAGELVGAYTASDRSLGDLERIRTLVVDKAAEIDVRMGGPSDPPSISLDELLRGVAG